MKLFCKYAFVKIMINLIGLFTQIIQK